LALCGFPERRFGELRRINTGRRKLLEYFSVDSQVQVGLAHCGTLA
jgi:hypothetical protein